MRAPHRVTANGSTCVLARTGFFMRLLRILLTSSLLFVSSAARSHAFDWGPNGIAVCGTCSGDVPQILPDDEGGAFIAWRDHTNLSGSEFDVFLQRITREGQLAHGWPSQGLPVCIDPRTQDLNGIASDGQGGIFLIWHDDRNAAETAADIYAQRVQGNGSLAPGWPENRLPVSRAPST